jgi:hypothetical protein
MEMTTSIIAVVYFNQTVIVRVKEVVEGESVVDEEEVKQFVLLV